MFWVLCSVLLFAFLLLITYLQHKVETKRQSDITNTIRFWLKSESKKKMAEKPPSNARKATPDISEDAYAVVTHKKPKLEDPSPVPTLLQQRYIPRQTGKLPVVEGEWQVVSSKKKKEKPEQNVNKAKPKKNKPILKPVCMSVPIKKNLPFAFTSLKELCMQALFYPRVEYKGQCMASYNTNTRKRCQNLSNDIRVDIIQRIRPISSDLISCYDNDLLTDAILFMFSPIYLTHIDLSWCKHITLASVQEIVNNCGENIYSMNLSGCTQFSEQYQFVLILKKIPNLNELTLAWCRELVKDDVLDYLSLSKHQIESLNLRGCELYSSTLLAELIKKLPLVYLNLSYCRQIDDFVLDSICQYRTSTLHTLDLTGCEYLLGVRPPKIKFDKLEVLLIRGCDRLTAETIIAFARLAGHNLVHFEFSEPQRREDFVELIGPYLTPKLEKYIVDITRASFDAFISSISHCINLIELGNFYNCTYLDSWGSLEDSSLEVLSTFTKLQSLEWSIENNPTIDIVFSNLKELRKFACYSFEAIPELLPLLSTHCNKLEVLKLSPFRSSSSQQMYAETELVSIITNSPNLKVLHLSNRGVTENVLKAIASSCPQLQDLDISNSNILPFSGVVHLLRSCPELKKLNLSNSIDVPVTQLVSVISAIAPKLVFFASDVSHFPTSVGSFARKGVDHVEFKLKHGSEDVIDIYLNNTLLQTKIKEVEMAFDPDLAGKYYSLTPHQFWSPPAVLFESRCDFLLGCDCGTVECWPLSFTFLQEGNLFIWTKPTNFHRSMTWSWKKMPSHVFDLKDFVDLLQPFT